MAPRALCWDQWLTVWVLVPLSWLLHPYSTLPKELIACLDDTGVISATLVSVGTSLSGKELTSLDKSIITSSTALFALVASPLSSILADAYGRKRVILLADMLFILGAIIQAGSYTVSSMVLGRSIVGAGVGAASFVTPMYIAELAPAAHRGRLITMNNLAITFGQVVAYVIGWLFTEFGDPLTGWRWIVGLGAVPAAIQCALFVFMPETPRWLVKAGKSSTARQVLKKTLACKSSKSEAVRAVLTDIQTEVREEQQTRLLSRGGKEDQSWLVGIRELVTVPRHRRALTIACLLQGLQQLCGFVGLCHMVCSNIPLTHAEFLDVLLGYYFYAHRFLRTDSRLTKRCYDQFPLHCCSVASHRSRRSPAHIALLDSFYDCGTGSLWLWLRIR